MCGYLEAGLGGQKSLGADFDGFSRVLLQHFLAFGALKILRSRHDMERAF